MTLTGCSSDKNTAESATTTAAAPAEIQASTSPSQTTASEPTLAPAPEPKKLSETEAVALDYVNIFLNGADAEAKKSSFLKMSIRMLSHYLK